MSKKLTVNKLPIKPSPSEGDIHFMNNFVYQYNNNKWVPLSGLRNTIFKPLKDKKVSKKPLKNITDYDPLEKEVVSEEEKDSDEDEAHSNKEELKLYSYRAKHGKFAVRSDGDTAKDRDGKPVVYNHLPTIPDKISSTPLGDKLKKLQWEFNYKITEKAIEDMARTYAINNKDLGTINVRENFIKSMSSEELEIFNEVCEIPKKHPNPSIITVSYDNLHSHPLVKKIHDKQADSPEFLKKIRERNTKQ